MCGQLMAGTLACLGRHKSGTLMIHPHTAAVTSQTMWSVSRHVPLFSACCVICTCTCCVTVCVVCAVLCSHHASTFCGIYTHTHARTHARTHTHTHTSTRSLCVRVPRQAELIQQQQQQQLFDAARRRSRASTEIDLELAEQTSSFLFQALKQNKSIPQRIPEHPTAGSKGARASFSSNTSSMSANGGRGPGEGRLGGDDGGDGGGGGRRSSSSSRSSINSSSVFGNARRASFRRHSTVASAGSTNAASSVVPSSLLSAAHARRQSTAERLSQQVTIHRRRLGTAGLLDKKVTDELGFRSLECRELESTTPAADLPKPKSYGLGDD